MDNIASKLKSKTLTRQSIVFKDFGSQVQFVHILLYDMDG
jgi:hypothetical protein